jgi:hypothetical protein
MDEKKRIRFDDVDAGPFDDQTTNGGAYRIENNEEGGWDVYVTETGEKICDDSMSWHFDVVFAIERHLNGEERVGQFRGPGPTESVAVKLENALREARLGPKSD